MKIPLLFLACSMLYSASSSGAYVATPSVDGLSAGTFKPLTTPALTGSNFVATGKVLVNGKLINIPGYIPPASTAAQAAKTSLWLNPWLIGASLLTWADDAGLGSDQVNGQGWVYTDPSGGTAPLTVPFGASSVKYYAGGLTSTTVLFDTAQGVCALYGPPGISSCTAINNTVLDTRWTNSPNSPQYVQLGSLSTPCPQSYRSNGSTCGLINANYAEAVPATRPATEEDFNSLPSPPPEAIAELAPQVGVPVDAPVYDPVDVPIGDPYTKPDGSTAEPRAKISPQSDGQVAVDTYDLPLTTPTGDPVTNPVPQDTPEPAPEQKTDCDKFPTSVGCTDLGTPVDGDALPHTEIPLSFNPLTIPKNATCPTPMSITAFGQSIPVEYDAACTYSSGLRPIVLAVAYLSAAFIIFGVPRANNG